MSCCPEYLWSDGYASIPGAPGYPAPYLCHYKVEWKSPAGDRGGWFILSTYWVDTAAPLTAAGDVHQNEKPFRSDVLRAVRQAANICVGEVAYTITRVYPVEATFPTTYTPPE